jgi:lipopolysaccharide/colanic/teichoic acid biosynthesis glycosyltransferase
MATADTNSFSQMAVEHSPNWRSALLITTKRAIDIAVSAALLVLLSPLLLGLAILIKMTSRGPAIYRWQVVGREGRPFTSYKFRTMVVNADQLKCQLAQQNEMTEPVFKMTNDPRITPIGRPLRRYSLDELPQLWSVLVGDMSLVGPRPPMESEFVRFTDFQKLKLAVKPGITCLWQVGGRNRVSDFDQWVRLDLEYIRCWSLSLDLYILLRTAVEVVRGSGK